MVQEIDYVLPPEESGKLAKAKMQVKDYRERVQKVDRDAERVDKTIQDQLNLKRTYASIIRFTIITILFAPIAFMTSLLALPIEELAKYKRTSGDEGVYSSGFITWSFFVAELATLLVTSGLVWLAMLYLPRHLFMQSSAGATKANSTTSEDGGEVRKDIDS
ncbi:uncharacterized protein PV07_08422 [Cladophialophora immunda]|uniref:Uncharacterized protein n=1 Tax=Cladophialophora immunda TaxID=569365 RepID=A0A0D1ZBV6_9EURO|nr:uncharacterized protein PV07_08422 [Cladophialophora immunda]KIW25226.1 hypothetical protein PV07_08422 [Cladophialophora immunda]